MTPLNYPSQATAGRLNPADHSRNVHFYVALSGDSHEDLLRSDYWYPVRRMLRRYDRIEVVSDDDAFFAELLVLEAGDGGVRVMPMRGAPLEVRAGAPGEALRREATQRVEYKGAHLKWCVYDGEKQLRSGFESEGQALLYLNEYLKTQRASA